MIDKKKNESRRAREKRDDETLDESIKKKEKRISRALAAVCRAARLIHANSCIIEKGTREKVDTRSRAIAAVAK